MPSSPLPVAFVPFIYGYHQGPDHTKRFDGVTLSRLQLRTEVLGLPRLELMFKLLYILHRSFTTNLCQEAKPRCTVQRVLCSTAQRSAVIRLISSVPRAPFFPSSVGIAKDRITLLESVTFSRLERALMAWWRLTFIYHVNQTR